MAASRLFIALWPGAAVRQAALAWRDRWAWPAGARLVAPERLHLTLHFLGDVAAERLPALQQALAVPVPPFELRLDQAAVWPHGVAVLQPRVVPPALGELHARLAGALRDLGLPVEPRTFRPHLTLARAARAAAPPPQAAAIRWRVRGHALVQSTTGRDGGYRIVARYGPGAARLTRSEVCG